MGYINLLEQLRQNLAKKSGIPSGVASADDDKKKVKEALDQTDPERKSQVLPQFANKMEQIMQLLGSIGMGQGGGSSQQQQPNQAGNPNTAISSSAIEDVAHGLAGALELEANTRGLKLVVTVYNAILGNNAVGQTNFDSLITEYQTIVTEAANLFNSDIAANTPMNSVIVPINANIVANSTNCGTPDNVANTVPDFHYQVHLPADQIVYCGYTQYVSVANIQQTVYTPVDYQTTPVFAYLNDSIVYEIQESFVGNLDPYFAQASLPFDTFVSILDGIMDKYVDVIDNASFGNGNMLPSQSSNTSSNTSTDSSSSSSSGNQNNNMVGQLLPVLNQLIQAAQSEHLPKSILDKEKVGKCLDNHGQNCGKAAQMKQLAQQAIQPGGIMGGGGGGSGLSGG
jgi:hypothetical protein